MKTITVRIDSLSYGGSGVGRVEGIVYFVPFSAPGDLLEVKVTKEEKRYKEAEIIKILEASPDRTTPPCPYFGDCGGCQWQHVSYPKQVQSKTDELISAFHKKHINNIDGRIKPFIESDRKFGYRRTARFKISTEPVTNGRPEYGFYRAESRELIRIEKCLLLDDRINDYLPKIDLSGKKLAGFDLFLDEEGSVQPYYRFSEKDSGADFFQVNTGVNEKLLAYVRNAVVSYTKKERPGILDIFCGDGNLSLQLADYAAAITGWDSSKGAISRGRNRAQMLKDKFPKCRTRFFESNVFKSWKNIAGFAKQADCIIIDPPRKGLKKDSRRLAGLNVPVIIYISCSPPALVRDLDVLIKSGYRIDEIQPLDMFPQTYHLETVAVLTK